MAVCVAWRVLSSPKRRFAARAVGGCAIEHIPGFTHPVEQFWLEDAIQLTGHRVRGKQSPDGGPDAGMLQERDLVELGEFRAVQCSLEQLSPGLNCCKLSSGMRGFTPATLDSLKSAMGSEAQVNALLGAPTGYTSAWVALHGLSCCWHDPV